MDERLRRGHERRLIFENVANGVPIEKIMAAFLRSKEEVSREVEFVSRKIREARFRTQMPPLECMGPKAIRWNRKPLLETLRQLSDEYLASDLLIPKIGIESLETPGVIAEVGRRLPFARVNK